MLVTLDIGNSHVRFGGFCGDDMQFVASIATDDRLTGEQYACQLRDVFGLYGMIRRRLTASCSVRSCLR